MTETVTPELDLRFREAAAAAELLGDRIRRDRVAGRAAARGRDRPRARISFSAEPGFTSSNSHARTRPRVLRSARSVDSVTASSTSTSTDGGTTSRSSSTSSALFARHVLEELA